MGGTATPELLRVYEDISTIKQASDISDSDLQEWSNKYVFLLFEVRYNKPNSGISLDSAIIKSTTFYNHFKGIDSNFRSFGCAQRGDAYLIRKLSSSQKYDFYGEMKIYGIIPIK